MENFSHIVLINISTYHIILVNMLTILLAFGIKSVYAPLKGRKLPFLGEIWNHRGENRNFQSRPLTGVAYQSERHQTAR